MNKITVYGIANCDIIRKTEDMKWENEVVVEPDAFLEIKTIDLKIPLSKIYTDVKL